MLIIVVFLTGGGLFILNSVFQIVQGRIFLVFILAAVAISVAVCCYFLFKNKSFLMIRLFSIIAWVEGCVIFIVIFYTGSEQWFDPLALEWISIISAALLLPIGLGVFAATKAQE